MVERRVDWAARMMNGALLAGRPEGRWSAAAIDSRRIAGGEIFFALPGERVDGHDYVDAAVGGGAAAVVVHRGEPPAAARRSGAAWLRVDDTFEALHDLTRAVRRQVPRRLVGITGSSGKTTTKELLFAMLSRRFKTARSLGNLNNLYGFPLSLLGIADDSEWMVAEMGMSTPGELRGVSLLGRPDVVLLTNVRPVHLEFFGTVERIAAAKAEIFAGLAAGGTIVANAGDPRVMRIAREAAGGTGGQEHRIVTYGLGDVAADVRATGARALGDRPGSAFVLRTGDGEVDVVLPVHGLYNVENAVAAAACAQVLGVSLEDIASAVADFAPADHRGEVHRAGGVTVIDDCYNSNPDAAIQALTSARQVPARRRLAVLGDMLELGDGAPAFHRQVGEQAAELGFEPVVGVGELAAELTAAAQERGRATACFTRAEEAADWACRQVADGDLILVKGSRGIGLEVVVEALQEELRLRARGGKR